MSVQAGIWNFDGKPVDAELLAKFGEALERQGPDGEYHYVDGAMALLYRPFHTTVESHREEQPYVSRRGFVVTWDGRLDNREELETELSDEVEAKPTDVELFAAAFDRWESDSFQRIIGDWAVSVWKPSEHELLFACDFMSIRHLFYYVTSDHIWWATDLTPLVLLSGDKFHIDDDYIAGFFAQDPDAYLTPYQEIRQVPPGQFVSIRNGTARVERFWSFGPKSQISYKIDADYEEQFRYVFRQSVRRRLRSDSPILAELSGGLDSSSIVCMADDVFSREGAQAPRLDTLSYYDRTEPDGDDWAFFPQVETHRGHIGYHIDASDRESVYQLQRFEPLPGQLITCVPLELERAEIVRLGKYKVVLSGIGGDEFLGGIPDPTAQLADLIVKGKLVSLFRQLTAWSLVKRRPWIQLALAAVTQLLPDSLRRRPSTTAVEPWIDERFVTKMSRYSRISRIQHPQFGLRLPSQRARIEGVCLMSNKLAKWSSSPTQVEEMRYPYLDRSLIEFILSIPATQLLQPGERRSLMRRGLRGLVPDSILSRKTKQFGARTPVLGMEKNFTEIRQMFAFALTAKLGYVSGERFLQKLEAARNGKEIHHVRMFRTISLEAWLRTLASRSLIVSLNPDFETYPGSETASHA